MFYTATELTYGIVATIFSLGFKLCAEFVQKHGPIKGLYQLHKPLGWILYQISCSQRILPMAKETRRLGKCPQK